MSRARMAATLRAGSLALVAVLALGAGTAAAQSSAIDAVEQHAWSENAGWVDFDVTHGETTVYPLYLTGFAWAENLGWVKLGVDGGGPYANTGAGDWGVNLNTVTGLLSGYAWSENAGWIRFAATHGGVSYSALTSEFAGDAWAENLGWVSFRGTTTGVPTAYGLKTAALVPVTLQHFTVD